MVGALELSKYSLIHTHQASSAVTWPSLGYSWKGQHFFYTALNAYVSVRCKICPQVSPVIQVGEETLWQREDC